MAFSSSCSFFLVVVCLTLIFINQVKSEDGYCAPYNGKQCKNLIRGGAGGQAVYYPSTRSGGWENEEITKNLFAELIAEVDALCEQAAQKLLCAYAFPKCKVVNEKVVKLPLCYEDCIAAEKLFCYNDWVLLEQNKQRGKFLKSRGHFRLPECEELPRYNRSSKLPACSYVGLTEINQAEVSCKIF